jgi:hypothetical protein
MFDDKLLKILEEEISKEKSKKKKKSVLSLKKEKGLNYYSGWGKGEPLKAEKQEKLD